jgi:type I restriction enzyme S subunit
MEMKTGYKQTELGMIPKDWELQHLGECLKSPPDYGINAASVPFDSRHPAYLRITDITEDGRFSESTRCSVAHPASAQYLLNEGDLVFARTGASVGKSYLYNPKDGALVFAGFLIRVHPDPDKLVPLYLWLFVQTRPFWNWVRTNSVRSGQPGINGREYASLPIPIPPTKTEQEMIAKALGDTNALIESLEMLIAKKCDLKQAAMQQLLTGRKRLPGFNAKWESKKIGDFTDCTSGGTPSTEVPFYWGGGIRWMSSGELNLKIVREVEGRITEFGLKNSSAKMIPERCVLVGLAGQGKTRGTVAMNMVPLCTNQSIAAILPNHEFVSEYLYYNLDSRYDELRSLSTGDGGRGGLNLAIIKSISIPFPKVDEQAAISSVLSDMDTEIVAIESRRDKTRALKEGMMQELLTGKTRLL